MMAPWSTGPGPEKREGRPSMMNPSQPLPSGAQKQSRLEAPTAERDSVMATPVLSLKGGKPTKAMGKEASCVISPTARERCTESRSPEFLLPHGARACPASLFPCSSF